jgi:hypothetical protein
MRYEFGPSSRGWLALWLGEASAGTIIRWPAGCANRPVPVVDPSDRLPLSMPRLVSMRGEYKRKPGIDLPDEAGGAARIES